MTGIFASLAIRKALDKLSSFLPISSSSTADKERQEQDLEDLRMLERTMRRIQATLNDAEQHWNIREETSKLRLKELKDLAYDAEDVVDEYEYEVKRCNAEALELSGCATNLKRKRHEKEENKALFYDSGAVVVPDELAVKARKLIERFQEIKDYSDNFTLSENDGERRLAPYIGSLRKTSSIVFEKSILGREQDKKNVVEKLLSMEDDNVTNPLLVLTIVGMGGLGKTTLAQLVYNDPRVCTSFNGRAWVCVSDQFDVSIITRSIIAALKKEKCDQSELCILQEELLDEIKGKKILLVLDDVWIERSDFWEQLFVPMKSTKLCTIIVTTRSERVARFMPTIPDFYELGCLSPDESWLLFNEVAFSGLQGNAPSNQVEIGKAIVKKCKGLPLAIKTLGSMLRYETTEQGWREVLESELWDLEQARNEVLPSLELSYSHMPIYLKRCFVALSLLPKDYDIYEYKVIELWKLLDLLQSDAYDDKFDIGSKYFNELVERSFLQKNFYGLDQHIMHDLIHDLACFLSNNEFFRLDSNTFMEIPHNARYIFIHDGASGKISVALPSLRAILVSPSAKVCIDNPEALFSNCEKLRVLVLDDHCLGLSFPAFMGRLKLLRHLKVVIPRKIIPGFGHLLNLQTLPEIHYSHIIELRSLTEIRMLAIIGLGVMLNIHDAKHALLQSKRHLQVLRLEFNYYNEVNGWNFYDSQDMQVLFSGIDMQVLDCLRPYLSLKRLTIAGYKSPMYPCWLGDCSFFNLTHIVIKYCQSQYLPSLGHLPSLVSLHFEVMSLVQHIGREFCSHFTGVKGFPSLTELIFHHMPSWSEWSGVVDGEFPGLHTLSICWADRLMSLPSVPFLSLVSLELDKCRSITTIPASPRLRILRIRWNDCFNDLPIIDVNNGSLLKPVTPLPGLLLNPFPSLECLAIICSATRWISLEPQRFPSLRKLHLSCLNLMYCDGLAQLTSLEDLNLWNCPQTPPPPPPPSMVHFNSS